VHAPQDPASQTEARLLMSVPQHIISAQSNKPSIGLVQDSLIGAWLLTGDSVFLSREKMCILHTCLRYPLDQMPPGDCFTGKQAFSMLLPKNLSYQNSRTSVEIQEGQLIKGRLCRQTLGTASGSLIHHIWLFEGPKCAQEFLSDSQRLISRWLKWRGFSIRLSDCEPDAKTLETMKMLISVAEDKVRKIAMEEGLQGSPKEVLEEAISTISNKVLTDAGKVVHSFLDENKNALYQDIISGAKGNLVNITQLRGLVGQQSVEGQRVDPEAPLDTGLSRKGFVRNSYFLGLDSREFFMHTMAGREGLIDTSVKTSSTGYLQRKLMKGMESIRIDYDLTCRNSRKTIIQFEYGGDGYDAIYIIRQSMDALKFGKEILKQELTEEEQPAFFQCWKGILEFKVRKFAKEMDTSCYVPVPFDAFLKEALRKGKSCLDDEVYPEAALLRDVELLCSKVCSLRFGWRRSLELLIRWHFRRRNVADLGAHSVRKLMEMIEEVCHRALVNPGEAIGPLASTSIGEPLTQLTLNTFHKRGPQHYFFVVSLVGLTLRLFLFVFVFLASTGKPDYFVSPRAGIKAHNVTLGVPRVKELIDCTKNPRTPHMTLVVFPSFTSPQSLEKLRLSLVEVHLYNAVTDIRFLDEPDFFESQYSHLDKELSSRLRLVHPNPPGTYGAIVVRMTLDTGVLVPRGLSPSDVASLVERYCQCHISASEELDSEWLLRIRFTTLSEGSAEPVHLKSFTEELVHKLCREVVLSGVSGIQTAVIQQESVLKFSPDDGVFKSPNTTIVTQGSNLSSIFTMQCLDVSRCTSNDVHEVLLVLGVEAATAVLFEQLQYTLQFDGSYINERHLLLLVSFMTCLGGLLPVSRHGINKLVDSGPLARASFEEVMERLSESAIFGDVDPVLCHSSRIMVGEVCRVGTGVCEVLKEEVVEESDSESDSVVFTMMEGDAMDVIKSHKDISKSSPIEMPFREEGNFFPKTLAGGSYIHATPSNGTQYVPSSPKSLLMERKRSYEPSSPKTRVLKQRILEGQKRE